MFRSATFKLTVWYLAIVMCLSFVFSIVIYHVATTEIAGSVHHEAQRFVNEFPDFQFRSVPPPSDEISYRAHRLLIRLVGLNIIVFFAFGLISYLLARRTLEPIETAHEQQKRFTSDVSHELRTPLTALRMESEVALLNPKASVTELQKTLSSNLEEVSKLESLINNLLRLSRLETDELQQAFVPVTLQTIVSNAVKTITPLAQTHKITIDNAVEHGGVNGDADSLTQLVVILLDNAVKYSPAGTKVIVTSQQTADGATLTIVDHGAGIAKADLAHIMERFYRADNSRTQNEKSGYGLGLSIAQMIVEMHGGSISFQSTVGKGTTVTVHLPSDLV